METSFNVTIDLDLCEFAEYVNNNLDIVSSATADIYAYLDLDTIKKYNTFDVIQINGKVPKKVNTFAIIGFLYDCIFASKEMMHNNYNAKSDVSVIMADDDDCPYDIAICISNIPIDELDDIVGFVKCINTYKKELNK